MGIPMPHSHITSSRFPRPNWGAMGVFRSPSTVWSIQYAAAATSLRTRVGSVPAEAGPLTATATRSPKGATSKYWGSTHRSGPVSGPETGAPNRAVASGNATAAVGGTRPKTHPGEPEYRIDATGPLPEDDRSCVK